jgi:phosphoribosylanthranilate isomerase
MGSMQFKVCGITNINQAITLETMGVDYIGFIFYAPSKRYVLNALTLEAIKNFKPRNAKKVGVFVNETLELVMSMVQSAGLDMVQLHGDEDESYCQALQAKLAGEIKIVKVFRVGDKMPCIDSFNDVADYYLFDTDSSLYGGTGAHFNWELLKGSTILKPFFLSGGIGPNDIGGIEVMKKTKAGKTLIALDMNSQFEEAPGVKNLEKIKNFINAFI